MKYLLLQKKKKLILRNKFTHNSVQMYRFRKKLLYQCLLAASSTRGLVQKILFAAFYCQQQRDPVIYPDTKFFV